MSVIVRYGLHSPTSRSFAYAAAAAAFFRFGLQTPSTSPSRTPVQPSMWNFALKPEPMKPTPSRVMFRCVSLVADPKLLQCFRRTAVPRGQRDVALVLHVLPAHLRRKESRGREIAKAAEEDHAVVHLGPSLLGPGNVVQHLPALRVGRADERLAEAMLALVVEPREPAPHLRPARVRRLLVGHEEVDE